MGPNHTDEDVREAIALSDVTGTRSAASRERASDPPRAGHVHG